MNEMDDPKILEAMQALSQDKSSEKRSAIARLRGNFNGIELALSKGVKLKAIWEQFEKEGYGIPLKTFESAVNRIRKERATQPTGKVPAALVASTAPEMTPVETENAGTTFAGKSAKRRRDEVANRWCPNDSEPLSPLLNNIIKGEVK